MAQAHDLLRDDARPSPPAPAATVTAAREGVLEIPGETTLHHGSRLFSARVAWRLTGPAQAPVVVALGGISAHRHVWSADDPHSGWWHEVVGPGLALPADRLRILGFDYLGGSGESSGPRPGEAFPSVSTYDQAEALLRLMNHLGIKSLQAIVGASYGGMVALAFAERHPERVAHIVAISAPDRTHPMATAWRSVQRRIVRLAQDAGRAAQGLELARALAMATYRSPEEFAARFAGAPRLDAQGYVFPVEDYLASRGAEYAARTVPESFLCLSESIDLHRVEAARIFVPATVIAVREDQLVPVTDLRALAARLPHAHLHEISSVYGHDAFLKEAVHLAPLLAHLAPRAAA
jgi:homoserine O-acetyltransferase